MALEEEFGFEIPDDEADNEQRICHVYIYCICCLFGYCVSNLAAVSAIMFISVVSDIYIYYDDLAIMSCNSVTYQPRGCYV